MAFYSGKNFNLLGNLKKHIKAIHQLLKDFKCDSCDKSYSEARDLKRHKTKDKIHSASRKEFKCESCGKSFSKGGNLKKHVRKGHNFGGKANRNQQFFKDHIMRVHSEPVSNQSFEKLLSQNSPEIKILNQVTDCFFCDEIFNIENDLEKHLRSNHQKELTGVD